MQMQSDMKNVIRVKLQRYRQRQKSQRWHWAEKVCRTAFKIWGAPNNSTDGGLYPICLTFITQALPEAQLTFPRWILPPWEPWCTPRGCSWEAALLAVSRSGSTDLLGQSLGPGTRTGTNPNPEWAATKSSSSGSHEA